MRRAICIKFVDGSYKTIELSKATSIRADIGMIHLDKLKNDTWRLTFSTDITNEFKNIQSFVMIREDAPTEQLGNGEHILQQPYAKMRPDTKESGL